MRVLKNPYFYGSLKKKKSKILKDLQQDQINLLYHYVTVPESSCNLLEIYPGFMFCQEPLKEKNLLVAGVAGSKLDAEYLVEEMITEVYEKTGTLDVRKYLNEKKNLIKFL